MFPLFDHTLSGQLDALVILLDHRPPWIFRLALRLYKRLLEAQVPQ